MRTSLPAVLITAALTLAACSSGAGGAGPEADADKSPAQIQGEVAQAEQPMLEAAIEKYQALIASKEDEIAALRAEIEETAGQALDSLIGGATDTVKSQAEQLQASLDRLEQEVRALREKLEIYVRELNERLGG